ncbi:MAG: beta-galactosidase trimerization domain-containing protein, partial [Clostridia bacterium]|nr:beta-galactosidase trimerization domain-containing protein [Clostridia bacterium]
GNEKYHGAARLLSELKYSYDIVDTDADFSRYQVIILPDVIKMSAELKENLKKYLKSGGKVISSATAALTEDESGFALPEWNFEYIGKDTTDTSYFHLNQKIEGLADMDYSYYKSGISMRAKTDNSSLADIVCGYFPNHGHHDLHNYRYVPPKAKNGNSAVLINKEETVCHIAFPIFSDFHSFQPRVYKEIIRIILEKFMPQNLIKTNDMPSSSRITLTKGEYYTLLHVKVTNPELRGGRGVVEEHTALLGGKTVAVKGEYKTVSKLPSEESVISRIENGYTYVTLPQIVGYDMFLLK